MNGLTEEDKRIARRYIICRSAIKGLNNDKDKLSELELGRFYRDLVERSMVKINNELMMINKYPLRVSVTDQPTVYEVKMGNRIGFIELNKVEMLEEIHKLVMGL